MDTEKIGDLKIERHTWQPAYPNEISILDKRNDCEFEITMKQDSDIEVDFMWDHGYDGNGHEVMILPVALLKQLMNELNL